MSSTALVPAGMFDSRVLTVLPQHQPGDSHVKKVDGAVPDRAVDRAVNKSAAIRAIKRLMHGVCIEGALSVLDAFGYKYTEFHYMQNLWNTADLADEQYFPDLQGRLARETPVFWFWGGPPTKLKWYRGTLQTVLEDRILCEIGKRGVKEVAKWVGLDLTEVMQ